MSKQRNYNNSRVVPEAVENLRLQPQANPVNKEIKYQPMVGDAVRLSATAQGLARLGQGLVDIDPIINRQAQENIIAAEAKLEEKNRKDWANVSKKVKGMAKFNPYNKRAYNQILSGRMARDALTQIVTDKEFYKRDYNEAQAIIDNARITLSDNYKQAGIHQGDYITALEKFTAQTEQIKMQHAEKYSEYEFQQTQGKIRGELAYNTALNTIDAEDKVLAIQDSLNIAKQQMDALGWKEDTQAEVLMGGIQDYIAENADEVDSAVVMTALSTFEINGQPIQEIIPEFNIKLRKLITEAKRANYDDKHLEWQNHQLDLTIANSNANREYFEYYKQNPNATAQEQVAKANELIEKYNLDEIGFGFLKAIADNRDIVAESQAVTSDPSVLQELGAKAALGTLTDSEVADALNNGQLNWKDGLSFIDRLNREAKADLNAVKQAHTNLNTKLGKNGIYGSVLGSSAVEFQDKANQIVLDLNDGKITAEEASKGIQDLERIANAKVELKRGKAGNDSFLLNANYIKSQSAPRYNEERAKQAFNQLGLERGRMGQKVKPDVTSAPNDNRIINGKLSPHKGYDLGATNETAIHNVPMDGDVIYAGYLEDFGNYVVIKYTNGTYARYGHLGTSTKHLQGRKILSGMYIGRAGSTGYSTGTHLHVDFWNKNREIISVEQFARGIK